MSNWQLSEDKKWHYARYTMQLCDALREDPTLLDDFTFNKALQKITESYCVDKETKAIIKEMKRK